MSLELKRKLNIQSNTSMLNASPINAVASSTLMITPSNPLIISNSSSNNLIGTLLPSASSTTTKPINVADLESLLSQSSTPAPSAQSEQAHHNMFYLPNEMNTSADYIRSSNLSFSSGGGGIGGAKKNKNEPSKKTSGSTLKPKSFLSSHSSAAGSSSSASSGDESSTCSSSTSDSDSEPSSPNTLPLLLTPAAFESSSASSTTSSSFQNKNNNNNNNNHFQFGETNPSQKVSVSSDTNQFENLLFSQFSNGGNAIINSSSDNLLLSKQQLQQTLIHLLNTDGQFLTTLHDAYLKLNQNNAKANQKQVVKNHQQQQQTNSVKQKIESIPAQNGTSNNAKNQAKNVMSYAKVVNSSSGASSSNKQ